MVTPLDVGTGYRMRGESSGIEWKFTLLSQVPASRLIKQREEMPAGTAVDVCSADIVTIAAVGR